MPDNSVHMLKLIAKGILAFNIATLVCLFRLGPRICKQRLADCYFTLNPFGARPHPRLDEESSIRSDEIPVVPLCLLTRTQPTVVVDASYSYFAGSLPWQDLLALLAIAVDRAPRAALEIGTYCGHTTRLLALNLPTAAIHTVDLPVDYSQEADGAPLAKDDFHLIGNRCVGQEYQRDSRVRNVSQHFADTAMWDFGVDPDITFVFVDGSHTYGYIRNDTMKSLQAFQGKPLTIVWHDCDNDHPDVARWLLEMRQCGYDVKRIEGTNLGILDYDPAAVAPSTTLSLQTSHASPALLTPIMQ
jgi:hypothetical protein